MQQGHLLSTIHYPAPLLGFCLHLLSPGPGVSGSLHFPPAPVLARGGVEGRASPWYGQNQAPCTPVEELLAAGVSHEPMGLKDYRCSDFQPQGFPLPAMGRIAAGAIPLHPRGFTAGKESWAGQLWPSCWEACSSLLA